MKVLVVGSGGREHALCWKIALSPLVTEVIAAPGNAGIALRARCVDVAAENVEGLLELALREKVDLVVVGPEAPLVAGLADRLRERGIPVFGPSAQAAQLEGSKTFSKELMQRHGIPTAAFSTHRDLDSALKAVERFEGQCVVKADGLAAGKGVVVCSSLDEARSAVRAMLQDKAFGEAGGTVVVEELLRGEEASVLAITDGKRVLPLVAAQDHKAAYDGDTGPNTGGMGAYAPAPVVTSALMARVQREVLEATVQAMAKEGRPFSGLLYAGLMIERGQPKVLEFNVRFGDPECQPLLALMKDDLVPLLLGAASGHLEQDHIAFHDGATMCVVLAAGGYPGPYAKGQPIRGLDEAAKVEGALVFHAGTRLEGSKVIAAGGRVLGVVGRGKTYEEAARIAYACADKIQWEGMRMRRDIGHRVLSK
ncbi:MAG: phosphoribosylamine--glycine ligase [Myxococcota bacterium]|jgi:phosphoribosylamine--glycine ligase|nr:phosphoribosylamine--glycine ligase [Myxococcota bacterium]